MSHDLYVQVLSAMFLFWNGARVLTYIPTIGKLLAREADVRSYSLLSWGSWALSNGTFALMLLEMSRGIPTQMFWMNLANTLMCLVVSLIILLKRFPRLLAQVNAVYRRIRRNDLKPIAAFGPAGLFRAGAGSPNVKAGLEGIAVPAALHARFGRRVLWVMSASGLAVAVTGTVAYGVWLNRDQLAHLEAMATARLPLGITGPASPTQQTSWSARITRPSSPPARATAVARAELAPPTSSAQFHHRAVPSPHAAAPQLATRRRDQASYFAAQNRRHSASHVVTSARPALAIAAPTLPTQQTPSPPHVALSSPPPARETADNRAELASPVSSAPLQNYAVPRPPAAQLAAEQADQDGYVATQSRRYSTPHIPAYDVPRPPVYEAPPLVNQQPPVAYGSAPVVYVYASAPAAYGYAYEGEYRDRRYWHDNGWHKGWRTHHHDDDDE
jgi:hypothetical protein